MGGDKRVLSDGQKKEVADLGFVILRGFYSRGDITRVASWLGKLQALEPEPGREAKYYETSDFTDEPLLIRVENIFDDNNAEMRDLVLNDEMKQVCTICSASRPSSSRTRPTTSCRAAVRTCCIRIRPRAGGPTRTTSSPP